MRKWLFDTIEVDEVAKTLSQILTPTPLQHNIELSSGYQSNIYLKREDLQRVRSYKIRGAFNKIYKETQNRKGTSFSVVCASAGNHAQGVAFSCNLLKIKGSIFMPATTPMQKLNRVKFLGGEYVTLYIGGDTFDDSFHKSQKFLEENKDVVFIHPFDDIDVIKGQATVGKEILEQMEDGNPPDYIFLPIGGGGLFSGISNYVKQKYPDIKIIGVEPLGAASFQKAIDNGEPTRLEKIIKFIDGAAVQKVGNHAFESYKLGLLDKLILSDEGDVCSHLLDLYNYHAIVAEPAGALALSALDSMKEEIKDKKVVVVISGGNNDIVRFEEIKERSLLRRGIKHYFIITFPQRAGAFREFLDKALGEEDDIVFFEFAKKDSREKAPALVGLELKTKDALQNFMTNMDSIGYGYKYLNPREDLRRLFNFSISPGNF